MSMNGSVLSPLRRESSYNINDRKRSSKCMNFHLNSLWSIWYGISVALLNLYIVTECSKRYFDFEDLPWATDTVPSRYEFHTCIGLTALAALLLPFFFICAVFKVGNLANDGFKLGRSLSSCSADPPAGISIAAKNGCHRLWQHCGPTAAIFHLAIAFCVLIPKLMMEARLIQSGFLPKEMIWKTDLDFLINHRDPFVTLNFTSSGMSSGNFSNFVHQNYTSQPRSMALTVATGKEFLMEDNTNVGSFSIEFLNYALALFIYAVRYPAVFWSTNKYFGILFSLQLLINTIQCLLIHTGISVLYKIHVVGCREVLPYLSIHLSKWALRFGKPFILNKEVTLALYIMSILLILISSLVLYLYGYGRLNSFLHREQARRVISLRYLQSGRTWGYFTHCVALCVLVAIAACEGPLLYDFSLIYRGSLDLLILIVILSSILHLFIWVLLWLILTLKQHWEFKLRITVGHATVRSARSIKLVTDVNLVSSMVDQANAPLLVVGHGKTYTISEVQAKRTIMAAIQKATMDKKMKAGQGNGNKASSDDGDEQIYWLRPKSRTPRNSPDSSSSDTTKFGWFTRRKINEKNSVNNMAVNRKHNGRKPISILPDDEGDYVRLREIQISEQCPLTPRGETSDDTASEDNKLLECVRNDTVTYASVNKELLNPGVDEFEDPSPLLTPDPEDQDELPPPPPELTMGYYHGSDNLHSENMGRHRDPSKCLNHSDSGMTELPSHSGSDVSSGSPPDRTCSNSETSSGIHSNSSAESKNCINEPHHQNSLNLITESARKIQPQQQWFQKTSNMISPAFGVNRIYKPQQHYAVANKTPSISEVGEDNGAVGYMRKNSNHQIIEALPDPSVDRFGRSTNMRMTSFTDRGGIQENSKCSATLPHYPTQPPLIPNGLPYPHCSTMPLPLSNNQSNGVGNFGANGSTSFTNGGGVSCGSFPRPHTTIPTHHNGIRLRNPQLNNIIYQKTGSGIPGSIPGGMHNSNSTTTYLTSNNVSQSPYSFNKTSHHHNHHTFPQLLPVNPMAASGVGKYGLQNNNSERDSANFSTTSSLESDVSCSNPGTVVS